MYIWYISIKHIISTCCPAPQGWRHPSLPPAWPWSCWRCRTARTWALPSPGPQRAWRWWWTHCQANISVSPSMASDQGIILLQRKSIGITGVTGYRQNEILNFVLINFIKNVHSFHFQTKHIILIFLINYIWRSRNKCVMCHYLSKSWTKSQSETMMGCCVQRTEKTCLSLYLPGPGESDIERKQSG